MERRQCLATTSWSGLFGSREVVETFHLSQSWLLMANAATARTRRFRDTDIASASSKTSRWIRFLQLPGASRGSDDGTSETRL